MTLDYRPNLQIALAAESSTAFYVTANAQVPSREVGNCIVGEISKFNF
jgi:hypothetical protein